MAVEIRMPELSSETTEADIVEWLVAVGDTIEAGDLIAEFETDKSTVEFESPLAGVVLELCVPAPSMGIKVGELIARIEPTAEVGSDVGDATVASAPSSDTTSSEGAPAAVAAPIEPPPRAPATALARRIAEQRGVDLTALSGSGSGGRVTKADVEDASAGAAERAVSPDAALSRMQQPGAVTADAAVAFHLEVECDGAAIEEQCARLNDSLPASALEFRATDFAVAAVARALRDVPEANVGWRGESLESLARVDLSVAIERDGGRGRSTRPRWPRREAARTRRRRAPLRASERIARRGRLSR
jgi:pyruvate dehydrogenase E2 component (dihydrolipoamide acetyltransferase)